ncbi:MAG: T9SS type A sorting domain-containing protein [Bacteroidota bacterium]
MNIKVSWKILFILSIFISKAQAQNTWVKSFGSAQFDYLDKLAADHDGNVYVAGRIRANVQIDDTLITKIGSGSYNYILVKLNEQGKKVWVVNFYQNAAAIDEVSGVTVDESGNVYVSLTRPGILFKYNINGIKIFEKTFQAGVARLGNVLVDDSNFVWVCGSFSQFNFSLDGLPAMPHHGGTSFYIARLDSNGIARRVIPIGSNSLSARVSKIAIRDTMVYVTANFLYDVFIKTDTLKNIKSLTAAFTTKGDYVWAKPIKIVGATGATGMQGLTVLNTGEIAIGGSFYEAINISGTVLSNPFDRENFYMALYKPNGDLIWAKSSSTINSNTFEIRTTYDNKLAVIFDYNFSFAFGGKSVGDGVSNKRYAGMMCVTPDGNAEWMKGLGQSDWTYTRGLAIDGKGNWFVGGNFQSTTSNVIDGKPLTAVGETDLYVIKNFNLAQPVVGNTIFCSNNTSQTLTATGTNVKWYNDSLLNNLLFEGNNYPVVIDSNMQVYVVQQLGGAVSVPKLLDVKRFNLKPVNLLNNGDTLTVVPAIGMVYRWYRNNVLLAGNSAVSYVVSQSGKFHALVIDSNTCNNFTDTINVMFSGLKAAMHNEELSAIVYPNPVYDKLWIKSEQNIDEVKIWNYSGQLIKTVNELVLNGVDVSDISSGFYVIEIHYSNGSIQHQKIRIQHQ